MVGAGVLVVALILIAPAILDGRRDSGVAVYTGRASSTDEVMLTHTIHLDRESEQPPVARQVVEPPSGAAAKTVISKPAAPRSATRKARAQTVAPAPAAPRKDVKSAPVRVAAASSAPAGWTVQLGSFSKQQNADRLVKEVSARGFNSYVQPRQYSEKTLFRVRVGPRDTRTAASNLAARLAEAGYKGQIMSP
jgi:cell division septation protein DedD